MRYGPTLLGALAAAGLLAGVPLPPPLLPEETAETPARPACGGVVPARRRSRRHSGRLTRKK